MHEHSDRSSQDKRRFTALKPFLMIVVFTVLAAGLLIAMNALGSGTAPLDWSWVFYAVGAVVLFVVLTLRARKKSASGNKTDRGDREDVQTDESDAEPDEDEESGETLDDVRRRIRRGKLDKRS